MSRLTDILMHGLSSWRSLRGLDGGNSAGSCAVGMFDSPGKKFLHVGCGTARKPDVARCFLSDDWLEIRLDIDPAVAPDIVGSMLDMAAVPDGAVDAIYSSHNIEHLYPHEVAVALAEFHRVLQPDGFLVLACPDLQAVCRRVADDRLLEPAYMAPAGPIAPLDILYGHRPQLACGNLYMAHHMGFTLRTLVESVRAAGFRSIAGRARDAFLDLWVVASKTAISEDRVGALLDRCLPQ